MEIGNQIENPKFTIWHDVKDLLIPLVSEDIFSSLNEFSFERNTHVQVYYRILFKVSDLL